MFLIKAVTLILAGWLSFLALRHLTNGLQAAKVRVRSRQQPRPGTRLRQDPRTGIYSSRKLATAGPCFRRGKLVEIAPNFDRGHL